MNGDFAILYSYTVVGFCDVHPSNSGRNRLAVRRYSPRRIPTPRADRNVGCRAIVATRRDAELRALVERALRARYGDGARESAHRARAAEAAADPGGVSKR